MTATPEPIDRGLEVELYRQIRLIRGFEDLVQSLFLRDEVCGTTLDDAWRLTTPDSPAPYSPPLADAHLPGAAPIAVELGARLT
jgi:hypothetical protein